MMMMMIIIIYIPEILGWSK